MPENRLLKSIFQLLPFIMIITVIAAFLFSGKEFTVETLLSYAPGSYFGAAVFILVLYAAKSMSVILPVSILNIATGCIFPMLPAMVLNTAGIAICLAISYWIGYFSGSDYVEKQTIKYPKMKEIVQKQHNNEWFAAYFLRILPLPCDMVSIYLGSTKISFHKYFIAGMIGSMPGIVSATLIGVSITNPFSPMCILSVSSMLLLALLSCLIYRHIQKRIDIPA